MTKFIFFGWNGEASEGKSESHYVALRHGLFISDLAFGSNNDPATMNCVTANVKKLKDMFYGEDTTVKVYGVHLK